MRMITATLLVALTTAFSGLIAAGPASASVLPVATCTGYNQIDYSPGLTDTSQTVELSGGDHATHCVVIGHPDLTSFDGPFSGSATLSCTSLFTSGTGYETLIWNTGAKSIWSWSISFQNVNGTEIGTGSGRIISGPLTGANLVQVITEANPTLTACSMPGGMTQVSGPSNWAFTP
jgi:hypothetical protein